MLPKVIAIAGGSCSGKTRLAKHTALALGDDICTIVRQDNYYLDYGGADPEGPLPNFDHPNAFEWDLLAAHIQTLKAGGAVHVPTYNFVNHRRADVTVKVEPKPIIIIEGILLLTQNQLLPLFDKSYFVECDSDLRLSRRIKRDVVERGRTRESVVKQFAKDVAPMHQDFVEPSKANADRVITQDQCTMEMIMNTGPVISWCRDRIGEEQ